MSSSSQNSNQPCKLRDLIKNIRGCKTAAEERALVQREKASIRESFTQNQEEYRPRNVAKLLFISMLGHDTDFGQMECLKLITKNSFIEKRIGYLGLTQLFHEKSEVLVMATHRIHTDLNSQSNYVISLALMALSEICTAEMCRELVGDLLKIMKNGTSFVKKKAALAATKIIKKLPETCADFSEKVEVLMEDRHHGVLLSTLGLVEEILKQDDKFKVQFKKFFTPMIRVLKGLVSTYSAEFDIQGISDPFLQIQILKFFSHMAKGNSQLSEEVSEILAQVAQNTSSAKNTGNAVLYECVRTIFEIESASTLKTLAINLLGKFLLLKDNNSKYLSLYMLKKVLMHDINSVLKHKQLIMDCLKEKDLSIKQLALDLTYMITNEQNVKQIIKELLNYLLTNQEPEFMQELTLKICAIVDKHSPNRKWHMDTIIKVLTLAGNFIKEESISSLIHLVCTTKELQNYAIQKLYYSLTENINQEGLAKAALYLLGEFSLLLTQPQQQQDVVTEQDVINLIKQVHTRANCAHSIKEYGLNCLIKIYTKFKGNQAQIKQLIENEVTSTSSEVQKRACEYLQLINEQWENDRAAICELIPEFIPAVEQFKDKPLDETGEMATIDDQSQGRKQISLGELKNAQKNTKQQNNNDLIDIEDILGGDLGNNSNQNQNQGITLENILNQGQNQQNNQVDINYLEIDFGNQKSSSTNREINFVAFEDQNLQINFKCSQQNNLTNIVASYKNKQIQDIENMNLQLAVVKYLKLNLQPISNSRIPAGSNGSVTQQFNVENSQHGQKPVMLKLKVLYTFIGNQVQGESTLKDQFNDLNTVSPAPQNNIVTPQIQQPQQQQQILQQQQQPLIQATKPQIQNDVSDLLNLDIPDLLGNAFSGNQQTQQSQIHSFVFTNLPSVDIDFQCTYEGDTANIQAKFKNKTSSQLNSFNLSVAVQKHCKCTLGTASGDQLFPNQSNITQSFKVQNSLAGQKGIVLKIRISFQLSGQQVVEQETVSNFPAHW